MAIATTRRTPALPLARVALFGRIARQFERKLWKRPNAHTRLSAMSTISSYSVGDRVTRVDDNAVGVVEAVGPMGTLSVRWTSGTMSVVVPSMVRPS